MCEFIHNMYMMYTYYACTARVHLLSNARMNIIYYESSVRRRTTIKIVIIIRINNVLRACVYVL